MADGGVLVEVGVPLMLCGCGEVGVSLMPCGCGEVGVSLMLVGVVKWVCH